MKAPWEREMTERERGMWAITVNICAAAGGGAAFAAAGWAAMAGAVFLAVVLFVFGAGLVWEARRGAILDASWYFGRAAREDHANEEIGVDQ